MSTLLKAGLLFTGCLLSLVANGQANSGVPLGVLPTLYNGSFAGETGSPRLNTLVGIGYNRYFGVVTMRTPLMTSLSRRSAAA